MKPVNHHGGNPAIAHLHAAKRKALLEKEARRRHCGDWGTWERVSPEDVGSMLSGKSGWVREVRAVYRNAVFCVLERLDATGVVHAGVASISGNRPTWYEFQRIKDELFGAESTAVEIYPPHKDIVDGSDMFHLWVLPGEIPFGLTKLCRSRQAAATASEFLLSK